MSGLEIRGQKLTNSEDRFPTDCHLHWGNIYLQKKNTYALKTLHVVALPFIYGVAYIIIFDQKRGEITVKINV